MQQFLCWLLLNDKDCNNPRCNILLIYFLIYFFNYLKVAKKVDFFNDMQIIYFCLKHLTLSKPVPLLAIAIRARILNFSAF